ncbi:MAG: hypothetical protein AAF621_01295 [Pseudomonadota bacterium]
MSNSDHQSIEMQSQQTNFQKELIRHLQQLAQCTSEIDTCRSDCLNILTYCFFDMLDIFRSKCPEENIPGKLTEFEKYLEDYNA